MAAFSATMIGLAIFGAASSMYKSHKQAQATKKAGYLEKKAADAQASLIDWNADIAAARADDALQRGRMAATEFRQQVRSVISTQRAAMAGNNVDLGYGTPLDVIADVAFLGKLDEEQILLNAKREAWGMYVESADLRGQAKVVRETGDMRQASAYESAKGAKWDMFETALTTGATLLQNRYGWRGGRSSSSSQYAPFRERAYRDPEFRTDVIGRVGDNA